MVKSSKFFYFKFGETIKEGNLVRKLINHNKII